MKVLYDTILKATYIGRPNRFVVTLDLNGERVLAHLPNPGRMWELLYGGNDVHRASRQAGCEDEISRGRHRARWRCYHARYKLQQRCGATFD